MHKQTVSIFFMVCIFERFWCIIAQKLKDKGQRESVERLESTVKQLEQLKTYLHVFMPTCHSMQEGTSFFAGI